MITADSIWKDVQSIIDTNTSKYRASLNSDTHVMDVGIRALQASDPEIKYKEKEKLHSLFRRSFTRATSLAETILLAKESKSSGNVYFVEDIQWGDYIVASNYGTMQHKVSQILTVSSLANVFIDINKNDSARLDLVSTNNTDKSISPLELKLQHLLGALQGVPIASPLVASSIKKLQEAHKISTNYSFNKKGIDSKSLNNVLGTGTVLVVLQSTSKNAAITKVAADIDRNLRTYLKSQVFFKHLVRSVDVTGDVVTLVKSGLLGVSAKKNSDKISKSKTNKLLNTIQTTVYSPKKIPKGAMIDLDSLLKYINRELAGRVMDNMGDGDRKDILNLRTGRLARSGVVERLSISRQGMLTAFYDYMKYPYATFSEGGAQQFPRSRDPKLLFSSTIREIAAEKVTNRMRSVLV